MPRPLRLLMIEDSDDDAALLLRELRRAGYDPVAQRVDTVADLERALDESWDIILCDYRMPMLDALKALSVVRGRAIDTPCIIVSGTVGEEHAVAALRSGAQDFVLKDKLTRLAPAIERELRDSETRIKHALAESTLRATEASFRAAFELIPDGVLVWRGSTVVHANGAAVSMLGAGNQDDVVSKSIFDLFASSEEALVRERMPTAGGVTAPVSLGELAMVRVDGKPIHVETTVVSVLFDGETAMLGVIRDVSSRRELVARAMQMDRMLAVGTLAAGVGHEINNPLAYVMANLTFANEQIGLAQGRLESIAETAPAARDVAAQLSEVVTILADVDEGAHRIRDIARDLNTFARSDEELRPVDLRAVADAALRMATPEVRHRARVTKQYEDVPPVLASASRVSQVLLNLVVNAAHAISKGAHDANEIHVRVAFEPPCVVVEVTDTGHGIAPENIDRLFTPFFTTKPVGEGTGLGLSISRRIVRSFGGDIEVKSVQGVGTTMRVLLPSVAASPPTEAPPPSSTGSPGRLLFIDDERMVGVAFQRAFSREHEVVVVQSATEGWARLAAGESFDAIFCDIHMPGMTGIDFYKKLEHSFPRLAKRVVLITGVGQERSARELVEKGRAPILAKPLDMGKVRSLLAHLLANRAA
jgi:PAS domain S-box-containing protein